MERRVRHKIQIGFLLFTVCLVVAGFSIATAAKTDEMKLYSCPWHYELDSGVYRVSQNVSFPYGITIKDDADVTIVIDKGATLTATGQDAYFYKFELFGSAYVTKRPATAGVVVPKSSTLTLKGEGTLIAKGGDGYDATDGMECFGGGWIYGWIIGKNQASVWSGAGGDGGSGGAAGGAGIGGTGSDGGDGGGGSGGSADKVSPVSIRSSKSGSCGSDGDDGQEMGNVYVLDDITVQAQAGKSGKAGAGGKRQQGHSNESGQYNYNLLYSESAQLFLTSKKIFLGVGAGGAGGGGGAAGVSANIGGSGAGGGGGGGGNDGAWYLASKGTVITSGWEDSEGKAGTADGVGGTGGIGGRVKENEVEDAAIGGDQGKGGNGGNLYLASTAKVTTPTGGTRPGDGKAAKVIPLCRTNFTIYVDDKEGDAYAEGRKIVLKDSENISTELTEENGIYYGYVPKGSESYKIYIDGKNTEKTILPNKDTLDTDLRFYTMDIGVTVDDVPVDDRSVGLVQDYQTIASLKYNEETGRYTGLVLQKGETKADPEKDTYEVWVDGVAFDITVEASINGRKGQAKYYTASVRVEVDGETWSDRMVSLYQYGEIRYQTKYNKDTETYQAIVPFMTSSDPYANLYDIYVNNEKTGIAVASSANADERKSTVTYSRAKVHLINGGENWKGQNVTIQKGKESVLMTYDEIGKVYQTILFTGDSETYHVYVNGKLTNGEICMTEEGKREITLKYMKATVHLQKDNAPWTKGATVVLVKDGVIQYTLANQSNGDYILSGVEEGSYDLHVSGSNSDDDVQMQITVANPEATVNYYTVSFHKNIGTQTDVITAKQIIRDGELATPATSPYQSGYTFLNWAKDTKGKEEYDFATPVTGSLELYAKWVRPSVTISNYVKCDSNGIINGDGAYFRMPNLVIHGYPNTGKVINTVVLYFQNATVEKLEMPSGSVRTDAIEKTGDGKITLRFYDESNPACKGPISVADAQKLLRNIVMKVVDPAKDASVSVMVYGDTNLVSERDDQD